MSIQLFNEYNVASCFLTGLFYDDTSGLNDEDIVLLNEFIEGLPDSATFDASGTATDFKRCDICNLMADTVELKVYEPIGKEG